MAKSPAVLGVSGLVKEYPGVTALRGVDLDLAAGEVHALVGENGAGKSTLIKILTGLERRTSGTVSLNGHEVNFGGPSDARAVGISVIAQEFDLVPQLSVVENIFLGREPRRAGLIDWRTARRLAKDALDQLGVDIDPRRRVETLPVADQQLVEIAKVLTQDFRIMILDEPTAALSAAESDRLFGIIRGLRATGVSVLYVSHRMSEIFALADRVTVLRDGRRVHTGPVRELTEAALVAHMLGRTVDLVDAPSQRRARQGAALQVRGMERRGQVHNLSFDVAKGEILGVAGLMGSGREELLRSLFGLAPVDAGQVSIDGQEVTLRSPRQAVAAGVFFLSNDRKAEGIFPDLSVLDNLAIMRPYADRAAHLKLNRRRELEEYAKAKTELSIRAHSPSQLIPTLSGGNQQKVLLGRALISGCRVLLLSEPTRGVDVGAKFEIHELIRRLAGEGVAVLVSSSDVPELVHVSHRCLVLSRGNLVATLGTPDINENAILAAALNTPTLEVTS